MPQTPYRACPFTSHPQQEIKACIDNCSLIVDRWYLNLYCGLSLTFNLWPYPGLSDPYLVVKYGTEVMFRTRVIHKMLSPQWNDSATLSSPHPDEIIRVVSDCPSFIILVGAQKNQILNLQRIVFSERLWMVRSFLKNEGRWVWALLFLPPPLPLFLPSFLPLSLAPSLPPSLLPPSLPLWMVQSGVAWSMWKLVKFYCVSRR